MAIWYSWAVYGAKRLHDIARATPADFDSAFDENDYDKFCELANNLERSIRRREAAEARGKKRAKR